jgi:hypothetical protein
MEIDDASTICIVMLQGAYLSLLIFGRSLQVVLFPWVKDHLAVQRFSIVQPLNILIKQSCRRLSSSENDDPSGGGD